MKYEFITLIALENSLRNLVFRDFISTKSAAYERWLVKKRGLQTSLNYFTMQSK